MQSACTALYSHLLPVRLYLTFAHYLEDGTIFGKWYCRYNLCCDFLYNFAQTVLILRRTERVITNVYRFSCKVPVILVRF
jgi:hypothetical protein